MGLLPSTESADETLPNYERAFASRPEVYAAWQDLGAAVSAGMDHRTYEVATVGAARALRSTYCSLAHGGVLLERYADEAGLRRLLAAADSGDVAGAAGRDEAVAAFAARVARGAPDLSERDVAALRRHGLEAQEVLDVILTVAARCFFSTVLDATGTRADAAYRERLPAGLLEELSTGRPAEAVASVVTCPADQAGWTRPAGSGRLTRPGLE